MAATSLYILLFLGAVVFFYWKTLVEKIHQRWRIIKALHHIPGPFAIPILGTVWQFKWSMKELTKQLRDWGSFYSQEGHALIKVWLGPKPIVIVIRPEAVKVVLESNTLITKGDEYEILIPWLGTGLLISTGAKWQGRRKMLTPSFHFKMLNDFLIVHDYQAKIFVDQLDSLASTGQEFDIFPYIKRCALDIICETAMGCTVKAQTNHNHQYVVSVQKMNELAFKYQRMPWLQIKPIYWLSGFGHAYEKHLKVVTDFTKNVIDDKVAEAAEGGTTEGGKKAFLDMLVDLSRNGELSEEDIREEVDTFMFEGHDTTSASMGWTLWCLAHNPECQEKIIEELDAVFGNSDRDIDGEDLKNLKYLERCIKEGLRLRPSVPNFTRRVEEDIEIELDQDYNFVYWDKTGKCKPEPEKLKFLRLPDGTLIPKGCSVMVTPFMIHTSAVVYDDPQQFNPDRFLEENIVKRHPYAYIPFSAGPRNCIGQKFALMEEKTVLAWFFRKYRIFSSIPYEENLPMPEIIIRPSLGFPVKIERRE